MGAEGAIREGRAIALRGLRGAIARKMTESLTKTAQLSFFLDVDASALTVARTRWQSFGHEVGPEDLLIEGLVRALLQHPDLNARSNATEAVVSSEVHCSVAISVPAGLVAPAIFNAHQRNVPEIAIARRDLIERARAGRLTVPEMTGGTITLSNLGSTRVRHFTPILNVPQVAIIGFGRIEPRPWATQAGELCVRPLLPVSLTTDHRFIDGEPAARFLSTLAELLEQAPAAP